MFKRFFKRRAPVSHTANMRFDGGLPAPKMPLAVIGDIHGHLQSLENILEQLTQDAPNARWVFVGDYIDRGEDSAKVLTRLLHLTQDRPNTICLLGNHEEMLLGFLDHPTTGNEWMHHGGLQTMASFGASALHQNNDAETLTQARDHLRKTMPEGLESWLRGLPRYWIDGNVAVVHAGADPFRPIETHPPHALTWGHAAFGQYPRQDGIWVVHGHTIVPAPIENDGVISIDTGAYATDILTAALFENGSIRYLQTTTAD